jgi:hypothetical protein
LEIIDENDEVSDLQQYARERWENRQKQYKNLRTLPIKTCPKESEKEKLRYREGRKGVKLERLQNSSQIFGCIYTLIFVCSDCCTNSVIVFNPTKLFQNSQPFLMQIEAIWL